MSSLPNEGHRQDLKEQILESVGDDYFVCQARCVNKLGPAAGIFVRQLLFWEGKGHDAEGWIYKTEEEMEQETGLGRRAQRKARKVLVGRGVLEEDRRGLPRRLHCRVDLMALAETLNPSYSQVGITDRTSEVGITGLASEVGISDPASEDGTIVPTSKDGTTEQAITESTSENTAETTQERTTRELRLQAGASGSSSRPAPPPPQEKDEGNEERVGRATQPTPISEIAGKRAEAEPEKPTRAAPLEINRIMRMLTDERYKTCGVYRRYEEGRLSDQRLLESVSSELTGTFEEAERYRWSVEECVKLLKEEEGIA
ncbi:MAG: hypothetical protein M3R38_11095 [Actinomycetota bacterium]|nr:hypothetical protein [Actinomycetota bacterium]